MYVDNAKQLLTNVTKIGYRTFSFKNTKCYVKKVCIDYCKILENVEVFTPCKNEHKNNIAMILQSA